MPVKLNSSGGGSVTLDVPNTASNFSLTVPTQNGTVLTTASTNGISRSMLGNLGGVDLVATVITSGSSDGSISFNNVFTSAYKSYFIVFNLKLSGASVNDLYMRYRSGGSDISTSYHYQVSYFAADGYGLNFAQSTAATTFYLFDNMGTGPISGVIEVFNPGVTSELKGAEWSSVSFDGGRSKTCTGSGMRGTAGTYDGFTFFTGDGNGIASGSVVSIYGRY